MSSQSPALCQGVVHRKKWYYAVVFRDTPHEGFRNTNRALPPHCNHASTTRVIHSSCALCGLSEVGFWSNVARTDVCIVPETSLSSPLFWRGVQRVAVSCHQASAEKDHVLQPRDHLGADEFARRWTTCTATLLFHWSVTCHLHDVATCPQSLRRGCGVLFQDISNRSARTC